MTVKMHVIELEDCGDFIRVRLQGKWTKQAEWHPLLVWTVQVPTHIGNTYQLGQRLVFKVVR